MRTIVLQVDNHCLRYSAEGEIPWPATNLPKHAFSLRDREPIYWRVGLIDYYAPEKELEVEVIDYEADASEFDPTLRPKRPVGRLNFLPLERAAFCAQLTHYQLTELAIFFSKEIRKTAEEMHVASAPTGRKKKPKDDFAGIHFKADIMDLTFADGHVRGTVAHSYFDAVPFRIRNDHLIAEFDNIKPFFVKALKRKTIEVTAKIKFTGDEATFENARSPQIEKINDNMLKIFRTRSIRDLMGNRNTDPDKGLFTPEDYFASLDPDELGRAVLPPDGQDLLATILKHRKVRNARQLDYLAARLHEAGQPLRFVLRPQFGFVFFARGEGMNHFVLELLDSHATYVWSLPREWGTLAEHYREVEREISALQTIGRGQYRRAENFAHVFWFVIHESAGSELVDGFPRWKNRLLEGLV